MNSDFSTYNSVFSWRYGSKEMRKIFSEEHKYRIWRKIWVVLADQEYRAGIISKKEFEDIKKHEDDIDIERILAIEKETHHDVVAAIKEFAEKAKIGGGKIHLGATSMDIVDNADALKQKEALDIIKKQLQTILKQFAHLIKKYAAVPCVGYTHLQPAEPTTIGYRFAFYAQDLLLDSSMVRTIELNYLKGKGLKGAVGTSASYKRLLQNSTRSVEEFERQVMNGIGISSIEIANQTYPRKLDFLLVSTLSSIAQSLYKFAFDLRIMQSPQIGEWMEPFGKKQVGSSAMPFKRNPINSEKICSLARYIAQLPRIAWDNASLTILERTLDDSANRRIIIPEAFLATDEILQTAQKILGGIVINEKRIKRNLESFAPFAAIEIILLEVAKRGGDRQVFHEIFRQISLKAWEAIENGENNPLEELLVQRKELRKLMTEEEIKSLIDPTSHIGNAEKKSKEIVDRIEKISNL